MDPPPSTQSSPPLPSIALILCSTRPLRACPQIAHFVLSTLQRAGLASRAGLALVDLADWDLPLLLADPRLPARIHSPEDYAHAHDRAWSAEVSTHAGFVFVTPQYNWGYPAAVKNAIDHLFNEWRGKPATIVTYGNRGGGRAGEQLAQVLRGVRMRVTKRTAALAFGDEERLRAATAGEDLGLDATAEDGLWSGERVQIQEAFEELLGLLEEGV